jgi:hypothetical protein
MSEWTYVHQYMKVGGKRTDFAVLGQRGAEGWELVSAVPLRKRARKSAKADVVLVFKRPETADSEHLADPSADVTPNGANGHAEQSVPVTAGGLAGAE